MAYSIAIVSKGTCIDIQTAAPTFDLFFGQRWQQFRSLDVADFLCVPHRKDNIDFFEASAFGFWVEPPDDRDEACIHGSTIIYQHNFPTRTAEANLQEKIGTPADVVNHNRRDHYNSTTEPC